jgi:plastocyanin
MAMAIARRVACVVLLAGAGFACSPNEPSPPPLATGTGSQIRIQGDSYSSSTGVFSPLTLNTTVGTTVTWTNFDGVTHSSISDVALWRADNIAAGRTFDFTFTTAGNYTYKCLIHDGMTGTIIVK